MPKEILTLAGLLLMALPLACAQESVTVTTYYPSPYGSYKEVSAYRMKVGTTYSGSATNVSDNNLIVEGNIGVGTANPRAIAAPNGINRGNLDVNDVWLRGANPARWASQAGIFYTVRGSQPKSFSYLNRVSWPGTAAYCTNIRDRVISCSGIARTSGGSQARRAIWYLQPVNSASDRDYCLCSSTDPNEDNRLSGCDYVYATCLAGGK